MNLIDFDKMNGLVPCIVQDSTTLRVLMLGFMNQEAYQKTLETKKITFYSRTQNRLWTKGETSGHYLLLNELKIDCDADTLLALVTPTLPVCHTGKDTCFSEENTPKGLAFLEKIIRQRQHAPFSETSYTQSLLKKGINKIAQKVGEEAIELIIEAKDDNPDLFLNEAADLTYHFLVLLAAKNVSLSDLEAMLLSRNRL